MNTRLLRGVFRRIRLVGKIVESRVTGRRIPILAHIAVTGSCNLRCAYCYGDYSPEMLLLAMRSTPAEASVLRLIDELADAGTRILTLLGGEPLMPGLPVDIGRIVDHVDRRGMICQIVTNGYFIDRHLDTLKRVDSVCVSLDGDEDGNDQNRGQGTFKRIIKGIDTAKQHGISVRINAVITEHSYRSFDWLCEFCKDRKIPLGFCLLEEHSVRSTLSDEQIRSLFLKALDYKRRGYPLLFSETALRYAANWPVSHSKKILYPRAVDAAAAARWNLGELTPVPVGYKHYRCRFPQNVVYIGHDGIVHPCVYLWNVPFGEGHNVFEQGFQKAWEKLGAVPCVTCNQASYTSLTMLFAMTPQMVVDAFKSSMVLLRGGLRSDVGEPDVASPLR